jgi:hypothetical protein
MADTYIVKIERDDEVVLQVELIDPADHSFSPGVAAALLVRIALEIDPEAVEAGALYALGGRAFTSEACEGGRVE